MSLRKPRVRALRPAVGLLDRAEELFLEPVRVVVVELLIGRAQLSQRDARSLNRLGEALEQLLSPFRSAIGHAARVVAS
jgi:hypothetical protein